MSEENIDVNFAGFEVEEEDKVEAKPAGPQYNKDGWQDYVLGLLRDDECVKVGDAVYPKCAGLRRLAELLLGDIVFYGPSKIYPPTESDGPGRATVIAEVHIVWTRAGNMPISVFDNNSLSNAEARKFVDAADTWAGNCQAPFINHIVATTTTKALGRALKSALALNVHTAEEMAGNSRYEDKNAPLVEKTLDEIVKENVEKPPSQPQLKFIATMANQLGIDVEKVVTHLYPDKVYVNITKSEASAIIDRLTKWKSNEAGSEAIPDSVRQ